MLVRFHFPGRVQTADQRSIAVSVDDDGCQRVVALRQCDPVADCQLPVGDTRHLQLLLRRALEDLSLSVRLLVGLARWPSG